MASYDVDLIVRVRIRVDSNHPSVDDRGAIALASGRLNYLLAQCGEDIVAESNIMAGVANQLEGTNA